jgi:hypothetical protein
LLAHDGYVCGLFSSVICTVILLFSCLLIHNLPLVYLFLLDHSTFITFLAVIKLLYFLCGSRKKYENNALFFCFVLYCIKLSYISFFCFAVFFFIT